MYVVKKSLDSVKSNPSDLGGLFRDLVSDEVTRRARPTGGLIEVASLNIEVKF